jgi:hypothetical protein
LVQRTAASKSEDGVMKTVQETWESYGDGSKAYDAYVKAFFEGTEPSEMTQSHFIVYLLAYEAK